MVEADSYLKLLSPSILDIYKVLKYAVCRHMVVAFLHSYTRPTCLRVWGSGSLIVTTCDVKMMSYRHCWGWHWQPTQTASPIHLRHMQSVWAHWYAVSMLDTVIPTPIISDCWVLGYLWCQNDVILSLLRLTDTSNLITRSILDIYKMLNHIDMMFIWIRLQPYTIITTLLVQILGFWVTGGGKMVSLRHSWGWQLAKTASCIHIRHIQSAWAHWYAVHRHMKAALHSHTHPTCLRFWDSRSHVESKWCNYIIVEADTDSHLHLQLLPWITCDIKIMSFCHCWCWDWQTPQT